MNVLIVEDEKPAQEKLISLLKRVEPNINVIATLSTVSNTVYFLQKNTQTIDVIFLDIRLNDGLGLDIFNQIQVDHPVIFTTAYDNYVLEAFKVNSIDYLMKPITEENLRNALGKMKAWKSHWSNNDVDTSQFKQIQDLMQNFKDPYKSRFMVKVGEHIKSIQTADISLLEADGKYTFLHTLSGQKFIVDYKMDELEELLNPQKFFRINRGQIIHIHSIKDVLVYSSSRLKVVSDADSVKEILVPRERVGSFKAWLNA